MSCLLCQRIKDTENQNYPYLVHEFEHSYLFLGEHQYYLGYCVLVSKNHYREMTDIPEIERSIVFLEMMKAHELIQRVFQPKKMNMCSIGNVVDHVHWHFFPRYSNDAEFKNPPWLQMQHFESATVSPEVREELIEKLRNELKLM